MTISTSSLGGGGALPSLAPQLTFPEDTNISGEFSVTGINGSAGLVTALSLTDKWMVSFLEFENMTSELVTFKLTVDSVIIWNSTYSLVGTSKDLLGVTNFSEPVKCNSTFLLEVQTATDTNITLNYRARPIL